MQAEWRFSLDYLSIFPKIIEPLQTSLSAVRIRHDSFNHLQKIFPFYTARHHVFGTGDRHPEGPSVKHLCVDDHSASLIVKQLDSVPALVHEDVYVSIRRISAYLVPHKTAQRMKTLSHICWLAVEPIAHFPPQTKHGWMTL